MLKIKNDFLILNEENCTGCTACENICPKNAIQLLPDKEGFAYPKINSKKCINCNLCVKICPTKNRVATNEPLGFYAAKSLNEELRLNCSSGGIFSVIAEKIISKNGVVYGAVFDDNFNVIHQRSENNIEKFRSSKYVQSNLEGIFLQVKQDLLNGRSVLFSGTPCQVDGLNKYLKFANVNTQNLITIDLICHGVPSPKVWKAYLNFLLKKSKSKSKISFVNFRNKINFSWHNSTLKIINDKGVILENRTHSDSLFFKLFSNSVILRPSCHVCKYANLNRCGDITVGDFWGVDKHYPELDDNKGTSLILINTSKGQELLKEINNEISCTQVKKENCLQPNLIGPTKEYGLRNLFLNSFSNFGFEYALKRWNFLEKNVLDKIIILPDKVFLKIKRFIKK